VEETSATNDTIITSTRLVLVGIGVTHGSDVLSFLQGEAAFLGGLAAVGDGILEDPPGCTVDGNLGALEGALEGIAVDLLQKGAATAEDNVVRSIASFLQAFEDLWNCLPIDTITLNDSNVCRQELVTSLCYDDILFELLQQDPDDLSARLSRVAAVGAHNRSAKGVATDAPLDLVLQCCAPIVLARAPNVERGTHASNEARRVLVKHVPHSIHLAIDAPRGDC